MHAPARHAFKWACAGSCVAFPFPIACVSYIERVQAHCGGITGMLLCAWLVWHRQVAGVGRRRTVHAHAWRASCLLLLNPLCRGATGCPRSLPIHPCLDPCTRACMQPTHTTAAVLYARWNLCPCCLFPSSMWLSPQPGVFLDHPTPFELLVVGGPIGLWSRCASSVR